MDDCTVDFDHHDPRLSKDPYPHYAALRAKCPVTYSSELGGFWVLTGYQAVARASRDDDTFLSAPSIGIPAPAGVDPQIPIETDAPMAQKYRRITQDRFSPAAAKAAEPLMQQITDEVIDNFVETGECDLVTQLLDPVAARFILQLIGFDQERWAEARHWIDTIISQMTIDPVAGFEAAVAMYAAIDEEISRHREQPQDDLITRLIEGEIDGRPLDDSTIINYVSLFLFGGLDTTAAAVANALIRLDRQPELRRSLIERPSLIPNAVEEFLRYDAPVQCLARTLSRDHDFDGHQMRKGDRALLVWASANRDPQEFPNPDEIDFGRDALRHLSFGVGIHRCLGSNYARSLFRILLETILRRLPDLELVGDPDAHRQPDIGVVYGIKHLPARFSPGTRMQLHDDTGSVHA